MHKRGKLAADFLSCRSREKIARQKFTEAGPGFRAGVGIGFRIPLTGGLHIRVDASFFLPP